MKLTITSDLINVLSAIKVLIPAESLTALLEKKILFVPKPGTIEDKGVIGKVQNFIYKFDETTECSKATSDDFYQAYTKVDKSVEPPPTLGISKNVGWSFYSLSEDYNMDIDKDLKQQIEHS